MNHLHADITPTDLGEHPELGVLQVLDNALEIARFAIIAAHPELADADAAPGDMETLVADHVLIAADAMRRLIGSYRSVIRAEALWRHGSSRLRDAPF